jgi:ABC-type phosphate transport system permease subunit
VSLVHETWRPLLAVQEAEPYWSELRVRVLADRASGAVYPPKRLTFAALRVPLPSVQVGVLGQDPYHGEGQACGLAFSVPLVVATEEALRVVPRAHREVAYSLGATRWQMVRHVLLPQATGGILTGTILAVSRGAGEVAPILFTGAAYYLPYLPKRLNQQFMELGYHVYVMATQSPDVDATMPILYATVLVLLVLTFGLNFTAILIRSRIRRRLKR